MRSLLSNNGRRVVTRLTFVVRLLIAEKLICSAALDPVAPGATYRQD
jgi:hypothetical protein